MTSQLEVRSKIQDALDQYIKPREQVNFIRRILAAHLASIFQEHLLKKPLALVECQAVPERETTTASLLEEYVREVAANTSAHRKFDELCTSQRNSDSCTLDEDASSATESISPVQSRLQLLRLVQKRQRLETVSQCLDVLAGKPASGQDFLAVERVFHHSSKLPQVPADIMNSLVAEKNSQSSDLPRRVELLEESIVRSRLQLRNGLRSLQEAKARSNRRTMDPQNLTARFDALNETRAELISWVETELSKASPVIQVRKPAVDKDGSHDLQSEGSAYNHQKKFIDSKYKRYVLTRQDLLRTLSSRPHQVSTLLPRPEVSNAPESTEPDPTEYLLIPCAERLAAATGDQKDIVSQSTHVRRSLVKQNEAAGKSLRYLAEESQLLPAFPLRDSMRRRSGIRIEMNIRSSELSEISSRIQPWIFAADSAKISMLETVAQAIEDGQVALERSVEASQEIDELFRPRNSQTSGAAQLGDDPSDEDLWLAAGTGDRAVPPTPGRDKNVKHQEEGDIWSVLHGNLGLLGQEDLD